MSIPVTVLDYGIGNLLNVLRALEHCGATPTPPLLGCAARSPAYKVSTRPGSGRSSHDENSAASSSPAPAAIVQSRIRPARSPA